MKKREITLSEDHIKMIEIIKNETGLGSVSKVVQLCIFEYYRKYANTK